MLLPSIAISQGIQPFGTYTSGFDNISLSRLNTHIDLPLYTHAARGLGMGLNVHLVYDTGYTQSDNNYGSPISYGWRLLTDTSRGAGGVIVTDLGQQKCQPSSNENYIEKYSYRFNDSTGYSHPFTVISYDNFCSGESITSVHQVAPDGSGYILDASGPQATVTTPSGLKVLGSLAGYGSRVTDTNGNVGGTDSGAGGVNGDIPTKAVQSVSDDTGVGVTLSGGGYQGTNPQDSTTWTARNPIVVGYTDSNGKQQSVTLNFTMQYGTGLLSSVVYPDGTSYQFQYSPPQEISTVVTLPIELASVTLPTGGTLSYQDTASADGNSSSITRITGDGKTIYATHVDARLSGTYGSTTATTTTITNPDNSTEVIHFTYGTTAQVLGMSLETAHYWYSASGPLVKSTMRCYNGANGDCTTEAITAPVTQIDKVTTNGGGASYKVTKKYTTGNLLTEEDDYDYGASQPSRKTATTYASLSNNITDRPYTVIMYDSGGNISAQTTYGYDETAVINSGISSLQPVTGSRGNQTSAQRAVSSTAIITTTTQYDDAGIVVSSTDGKKQMTSYVHDSEDACLISTTRPSTNGVSHVTGQQCDANTKLVISTTDENKNTTSYTYDAMLRPKATTFPDGGSASVQYNTSTPPFTITTTVVASPDPTETSSITLDGYGRTVTTVQENGSTVTTSYNSRGLAASVTNPYRSTSDQTYGTTTYAYDTLGRVTVTTFADKNTTIFCYDGLAEDSRQTNCSKPLSGKPAGTWVDFADQLGHKWQKGSDAFGRIASVLEPDDNNNPTLETDYAYNSLDNLVQVDQWGGLAGSANASSCLLANGTAATGVVCDRQRTFSYDKLSRLTSTTNPESGTVGYVYDDDGNVHTKTDARGIVTTYAYDGLNRLTSKTYSDSTLPASYAYDVPLRDWNFPDQSSPSWAGVQQGNVLGRLSYESNSSSTIVYGYDGVGRPNLKSVCTPSTCGTDHFDFHAKYDLAGNVIFADRGFDAARNAASPNTGYYYGGLTIAYNNASQLTTADSDIVDAVHPQSLLSAATYSPLGGIQTVALGSQYGQTFSYNSRGQLTDRASFNLQGTLVLSDHWMFDPAGNVLEARDSGQGDFSYVYDNLNRVTHANIPPFSEDYGYDNWGNQTSHTVTDGSSYQWAFTPTTQNRASNPGTAYDAAGNMLADGVHSYTYDAENRLAAVTDQGITYRYDPEGMRVATLSSGEVIAEYLYDLNGDLVTMVNNQGQLVRAILRANRTHWGDYIGAAGPGGARTEFRLVNQVGTLVANADTNGNFIEGCLSGPFGDGQQCTDAYDYTETHFADKLRDQETNLDYFGARYFNSIMSRFTSPDPSGAAFSDLGNPQSWNLYSYVQNNPLSSVDPDGFDCVYINSDSGQMTGFSRGDCDNSTTASANSGYYFDGMVNTVYTTTGDTSGQVVGVQGASDATGGDLYQANPAGLAFGQPNASTSTSGMDTIINTSGDYSQTTQFNHGSHPFRDNNPGDIVSGGFVNGHGAIGTDGRFGVFPSAGQGRAALDALLHSPSYSSLSVDAAVARYAPAFENNTAGYTQFLQNAVGVSGNTPLSSLSPSQMNALENGITHYEGAAARGNYSISVTSNF